MSSVGYGPLWRIDGPLPEPPVYGLLQAAAAPAQGVRFVVDTTQGPVGEADVARLVREGILDRDAGTERWLAGVEVFPYPHGGSGVFDTCAPGSIQQPKGTGDASPQRPQYGPLTVYVAESCTSYRVWDQDRYKARAVAVLEAVQSSLVASELMTGAAMPLNPHLSDGAGTFPNGDAPTSLANAVALLEGEIAKSGRFGLIHMSPMAAAAAGGGHLFHDQAGGVIRTYNGTVVIADPGYVAGGHPQGHAPASGTQEWVYATGLIDVRRTETFVMPENVSEALDRGLGATLNQPNRITYRAERYYLTVFDDYVHAAVLADRCKTTC